MCGVFCVCWRLLLTTNYIAVKWWSSVYKLALSAKWHCQWSPPDESRILFWMLCFMGLCRSVCGWMGGGCHSGNISGQWLKCCCCTGWKRISCVKWLWCIKNLDGFPASFTVKFGFVEGFGNLLPAKPGFLVEFEWCKFFVITRFPAAIVWIRWRGGMGIATIQWLFGCRWRWRCIGGAV